MKRVWLLGFGAVVVAGAWVVSSRLLNVPSGSPQAVPSASPPRITLPEQCDRALSFADYLVGERYRDPAAAVDFSTAPEAENFHTVLANGTRQGVNFAGRYTVVSWGCGTSCQSNAVVDAVTGRIVHFGLVSTAGVSYRIDSALLVVNPLENLPDGYPLPLTTEYYLLRDGQLEFACRTPIVR